MANRHYSEAEFVQNTRNWFRACDERGMEITDRIKNLNAMYEYMVGKCNLSDYSPPITHVKGIPIKKLYCIQLAQGSHYLDYLHARPTIPGPYPHWQLKVFFPI